VLFHRPLSQDQLLRHRTIASAGGEFGENFRLSPGTGNALLTRRGPPYLSPVDVDPLGQTGKQATATMKCQRYQRRKR
jgi:hypothetical protein